MIPSRLFEIIEEQVAVKFTGKVNVLSNVSRQYLGHLLFLEGELVDVVFQTLSGAKAFYQIILKELQHKSFHFVIEPEIVQEQQKRLGFSLNFLSSKISDYVRIHQDTLKLRPPQNVRLMVDARYLFNHDDWQKSDYEVLKTLTEWSKVDDVFENCPLYEFEITNTLVKLRKMGALKILPM